MAQFWSLIIILSGTGPSRKAGQNINPRAILIIDVPSANFVLFPTTRYTKKPLEPDIDLIPVMHKILKPRTGP